MSTTAVTTDVCWSDVIQNAKCNARNNAREEERQRAFT